MVADGLPLPAISQTQLRLRLGGGSWQALREELERAQAEAAGAPMSSTRRRPAEHLATIASLLDEARQELTFLAAAHEAELRGCRQEVQRLRDERDSLRHDLAGIQRKTVADAAASPARATTVETDTGPAPAPRRQRSNHKTS